MKLTDEPKDKTVITSRQVIDGSPVVSVTLDEEGIWQCGFMALSCRPLDPGNIAHSGGRNGPCGLEQPSCGGDEPLRIRLAGPRHDRVSLQTDDRRDGRPFARREEGKVGLPDEPEQEKLLEVFGGLKPAAEELRQDVAGRRHGNE